jgi:Uncharacterized membrane-associated protein/domain
MNLRFYILCTAAFALGIPVLFTLGVPFLADSNITATIHGATYAWDTLEPLNDTVIDINSNPPQSIVAKNGIYSFELGPGDYIITASYYRNNTLVYSKQTTLKIEDEGSYVFDLLLYPVSENWAVEAIGGKSNNINNVNPAKETKTDSSTISYLGIVLMLFFLIGGGYKLSRKHKEMKKTRFQAGNFDTFGLLAKVLGKSPGSGMKSEFGNIEETISVTEQIIEPAENSEIETVTSNKLPLSTDLQEVLEVIRGHRGRITQKDLRSRLEYSEVKVSLLLSELEKRGLVSKFKHGRENIVTLTDEGRKGR